ncbi:Hypothetical predicted protein [Pelobates cultripes]|uniref:Uncharacterized protein n=1 Tax=Pelobates cultripes TaxID=61616 RepID=A0AAD1S441_PELCU|nr:Hypothetical predicted protein [Pelobates cultripes]
MAGRRQMELLPYIGEKGTLMGVKHPKTDNTHMPYPRPHIGRCDLHSSVAWRQPGGRCGRSLCRGRPGNSDQRSVCAPHFPPLGSRGLSRPPSRRLFTSAKHLDGNRDNATHEAYSTMVDDKATQSNLYHSSWEARFRQKFDIMCQQYWKGWEEWRKPPVMPAPQVLPPDRAPGHWHPPPEISTRRAQALIHSPQSGKQKVKSEEVYRAPSSRPVRKSPQPQAPSPPKQGAGKASHHRCPTQQRKHRPPRRRTTDKILSRPSRKKDSYPTQKLQTRAQRCYLPGRPRTSETPGAKHTSHCHKDATRWSRELPGKIWICQAEVLVDSATYPRARYPSPLSDIPAFRNKKQSCYTDIIVTYT